MCQQETDRCSPSCQPGKLLFISPKLGLLQLPKGVQTSERRSPSAAYMLTVFGFCVCNACWVLPWICVADCHAWFVAFESFWPTGSNCVELWCFELFLLDECHTAFPVNASHDQRLFFGHPTNWRLVSTFFSVVLDLLDKNIHKYHNQNLTLGCVVAFMTVFCLGAVFSWEHLPKISCSNRAAHSCKWKLFTWRKSYKKFLSVQCSCL